MSLLDTITIASDPETGAIIMAKRGALGGRIIDQREVAGEVLAALVACLTHGLEAGQGSAHYLRVTRPDGGRACYDLRLAPIAEAIFEGEI